MFLSISITLISISVLTISILAIIVGLVLGITAEKFKVITDDRIDQVKNAGEFIQKIKQETPAKKFYKSPDPGQQGVNENNISNINLKIKGIKHANLIATILLFIIVLPPLIYSYRSEFQLRNFRHYRF